MKKKLLTLMAVCTIALGLVACGEDEAPANTATAEVKTEAPAQETGTEVAETSGEFTILDVSADLVDAAIYSVDENNTEYVITLFRDPAGQTYISMMIVAADASGDICCGPYDDSCISQYEGDDGVTWTGFDITDVYTGDPYSIIFTEGDDGSVAVTNADFSVIMEGRYLSNDEAINYMGVAANFIN